ncbi:hypothetical protein BDW22DRAFT_1433117 [Trametopsis cervina]|nr:hypothetical protein BDW22DRAFT_1433117 [Trametopsis cervina]
MAGAFEEATAGPLLVFVCLAFIVYGIFVAQLYYYSLNYPNDSRSLRGYVWFVALLETCHTVFCIVAVYAYLIIHFGDAVNGVDRVNWSMRTTVVLEIMMVALVQGLYTWRIWHVSNKSMIMPLIPAFLFISRFCLGITSFGLMSLCDTWVDFLQLKSLQGTLSATYATELATDASISAILVYCIPAVIITFNAARNNLLFAGLIELRSKLYANTMLALLNARRIITNREIELHTVGMSRGLENSVQIYTDTIVMNDANELTSGNDWKKTSKADVSSSKPGKDSRYSVVA